MEKQNQLATIYLILDATVLAMILAMILLVANTILPP